MGLIQLYVWEEPNYQLKAVKGEVNYIDWLMAEKDRINAVPGRVAEIRKDDRKRFGLFVNDVGIKAES